jgi:hypothetical protein
MLADANYPIPAGKAALYLIQHCWLGLVGILLCLSKFPE